MTKKLSGFVRRPNGYWYYRARVPKDLLRFYPEREKWISLGTKNEDEAKAKFHLVAAEKLREYASVRQKHADFLGQQSLTPSARNEFTVDREHQQAHWLKPASCRHRHDADLSEQHDICARGAGIRFVFCPGTHVGIAFVC